MALMGGMRFSLIVSFLLLPLALWARFEWPTEYPPSEFVPLGDLLQATESGDPASGGFGCVRNDGMRFHEAVDLRSFERDKRGESLDAILAAFDGKVRYVNAKAGKSSFGRYIVVEHSEMGLHYYTLYAHLRRIQPGIKAGSMVHAGQRIGTMGRSASYTITRDRSHLHFEVCLQMSNEFQDWYDWKEFDSANDHGVWNGMNLVGMNSQAFLEYFMANPDASVMEFLIQEPTAFTVMVSTTRIPYLLERCPGLIFGEWPKERVGGWRIEFTGYGVPKSWSPLYARGRKVTPGKVALVQSDMNEVQQYQCRNMLVYRNGKPVPGSGLQSNLQLLLGFR